jgi:hypothetical protein
MGSPKRIVICGGGAIGAPRQRRSGRADVAAQCDTLPGMSMGSSFVSLPRRLTSCYGSKGGAPFKQRSPV